MNKKLSKSSEFISKFFSAYVVNFLIKLLVFFLIADIAQNGIVSVVATLSYTVFFTTVFYALGVAVIWHLLSSSEEKTSTMATEIRNIFISVFFVNVSFKLYAFDYSGMAVFAQPKELAVFYLILMLQTFLIFAFDKIFTKLFNKEKFINKLITLSSGLCTIFLYWAMLAIVVSWLPLHNMFTKLVTYPIFAMSAPLAIFVPKSFDIIAMMIVAVVLKIMFQKQLNIIIDKREKELSDSLNDTFVE